MCHAKAILRGDMYISTPKKTLNELVSKWNIFKIVSIGLFFNQIKMSEFHDQYFEGFVYISLFFNQII